MLPETTACSAIVYNMHLHTQILMNVRDLPMEDVIILVPTLMVATTVLVMMDMILEMIHPVVLVCEIHFGRLILLLLL